MNKKKILLLVLLLLTVLLPFGCKKKDEISVNSIKNEVIIKDTEVSTYDYKTLFKIELNGEEIGVIDSYINKSSITSTPGTYVVICTYKENTASVNIKVEATIYEVSLSQNEITLLEEEVDNYNFLSLFKVKIDNTETSITSNMIESNVKAEEGNYTFKVTIGNISKTLTVIVKPRVILYELTLSQDEITLLEEEVDNYNFLSLFKAKIDNIETSITSNMIESNVKAEEGNYTFKVTVGNISKTLTVIVKPRVILYELTLSQDEITINETLAETYNFVNLFKAKIDNEEVSITSDMIESNVDDIAGTYTFKVTIGNISKTLNVIVTSDHEIVANVTYTNYVIELNDVNDFDYTCLFDLYVDGEIKKVTMDMIDKSSLENVEVDKTYKIIFNYTLGKSFCTKETNIKVVADSDLIVNTKNIIIYPNSEYIDLTSLFEIKKGEEIVNISSDMINGVIDYTNIGLNTITLNYLGSLYTSTVEIKRGVIINYANSDIVTIVKGTNKNTYPFNNDFIVLVNGIKMNDMIDSYIDNTNVDFNATGLYDCTIKIPYNDTKLPRTGVNFTYFEKTIKYNVIENNYNINIKNNFVTLPKDTIKYDVFNNISVTINNRNQALTQIKDYVDSITCYVESNSNIDFNSVGEQVISISVYINGVDKEPVIVTYKVIIDSNIEITSKNILIFTDETIYTKDLFTITEDDKNVDVTNEMITGKVDVFTPGVYYVNINYKNIIKEAKVVVYSKDILGTYHTKLSTIGSGDNTSDTDEEGYEEEITQTSLLGDLVFTSFDLITVNNITGTVLNAIDENTFVIKVSSYEFVVYFNNGILVLDPDNSIKLRYNDIKRPLIYFNENMYTVEDKVTISSSTSHVLELTTISYTIDTFKLKNINDNTEFWYGIKIHLIEKSSSDTIYTVSWGEVEYASNFEKVIDCESSLTMNNEKYTFIMTSKNYGKTNKSTENKLFANKTFLGNIHDKEAKLVFNSNEGFDLYIDNIIVASISSSEYLNMCNIVSDYVNKTVLMYSWDDDNVYSYKFNLDLENLTFEYIERDKFYGKYKTDSMYLFINGYGEGIINFNFKSYYTTQLNYVSLDDEMFISFINTLITFKYGKTMNCYLDTFGNVLTVNKADENSLIGLEFKNSNITDGAIVTVGNYKIGAMSSTNGKSMLYSNIEIITKDGILNNTQKASFIDTTKIRFTTAGIYQYIINIPLNGETISQYYAVQILENKYEDNEIAKSYGSGILYDYISLSIDTYGQAFISYNDLYFSGSCIINDDLSFIIKAENNTGNIVLTGTKIANGIVLVQCTGAVSFKDYFTTGTYMATGIKNFILRKISVNNEFTYILSTSETSTGSIVNVEEMDNNILKITNDSLVYYAKVNNWNSFINGITLSDAYIGTYTCENNDSIILDGFDIVKIGNNTGTYLLNGNNIIVTMDNTTKVYKLNKTTYSYEQVDITLDNTLLINKTYSSGYSFSCSGYIYTALTTFEFKENNKVVIKSTSEDHDNGEDRCTEDNYNPIFASKDGVNGTYFVSGNVLTININNIQFTFLIDNVLTLNTITCTATTLDSSEHGAFSIKTVFTKN